MCPIILVHEMPLEKYSKRTLASEFEKLLSILLYSLQYLSAAGGITNFRLEYEDKIEYEYDFSNRERILKVIEWHTNIVPKAFTSTDQQQGEATALGT